MVLEDVPSLERYGWVVRICEECGVEAISFVALDHIHCHIPIIANLVGYFGGAFTFILDRIRFGIVGGWLCGCPFVLWFQELDLNNPTAEMQFEVSCDDGLAGGVIDGRTELQAFPLGETP